MNIEGLPGAWVLEVFQRAGVDLERLKQQQPDAVYEALYRPNILSPDYVNQLLIACAEISGNDHFGLCMNQHVDITMYGLLGYILLQTSTVKEFIDNLEQYYPIFYNGAFFKINTTKDSVYIQYGTDHSANVCPRHDNEWSMGFVVEYLKSHLGDFARPVYVKFIHDAPHNIDKLQSVFGENIEFNQTENQLVYKQSILNKKLTNADPWLLKILRKQADQMLQAYNKYSSLEREVRILLLENLEQGKSNASDIALKLSFSLSTFKRKLAQENLDFSKIKESVRNEIAKELLSKTKTNIAEIAKKIGFYDQGSFTRFFIRCNNMTPNKFRKLKNNMS
jgi:AraC-like DNA-binding protein